MKSKQVLELLKITRPTLTSYVKTGKIKVIVLGNGYYDYNEEDVYKFLNKSIRTNVIYARVSTHKQKNDLANQVLQLIEHCDTHNIKYDKIYQEVASGIDFERKQFSLLLSDIINKKIGNIYITYKDRLSRLSFITLENMFKQFGTHIIVINNVDKQFEDDLFEELISVIHLFSTKIYSHRRKNIIKSVVDNLTE